MPPLFESNKFCGLRSVPREFYVRYIAKRFGLMNAYLLFSLPFKFSPVALAIFKISSGSS